MTATADHKRHAAKIVRRLRKYYPSADCALNFDSPFQLLIATILSAQCTDQRVNIVTKKLFKKYETAADFACCMRDLADIHPNIESDRSIFDIGAGYSASDSWRFSMDS